LVPFYQLPPNKCRDARQLNTGKHKLQVTPEFYGILSFKLMTERLIIGYHRHGSLRKRRRCIFLLEQKDPKVRKPDFQIVSRTCSKARDVQRKIHVDHAEFQIHISISSLGWQIFLFSVKERWGLGVKREIQERHRK